MTANLSSPASWRVHRLVLVAHREALRHYVITDSTGDGPDMGDIEAIATHLARAVDAVQHTATGRVDRDDWFHRICVDAVLESLTVWLIPWGGDAGVRTRWRARLQAHASALVEITDHLQTGKR